MRKSKEKIFEENYKPWVVEHQKLPTKYSLDPLEKKLGIWRYTNRNWKVLEKFNSQFNSGWKSKEKVFEEEYIPWCKEYQKLPTRHSPDPIEKRLGRWRIANRNWEVLEEFNSQYNPQIHKSKEKVFEEDYKPWVLEHQKLPIRESPDPIEKKLGIWKRNRKNWEVLREFNSRFEPRCKPKEKIFKEEYISWVLENQRFPIRESPDPIEKKLGFWRSFNRKWNKLIQFNILFSYSKEGNTKANELLEKMMH